MTYVTRSQELRPDDLAQAVNLTVRAMAQHQLQHLDEARRALDEASQLTGLQADANDKGDFNLLIAQILLREADALITGKPEPKPAEAAAHAPSDKRP